MQGRAVDATDASFDGTVATTVPVLVDLWAPWCGPCRMVTPMLQDLARQRAGQLKVVKVNVDDSPGIAARYQVQGIPTLLLFKDGKLTARQTGALPRPSPSGSTLTRPPEPPDYKENVMRRTLTAVAALTATLAMLAATEAPAAAHPRRTTYTVTSTTPAGPTPHFPAFDPTSGHVPSPTSRRTPSPTSRSAPARPAPSVPGQPPTPSWSTTPPGAPS